MDTNTKKTYNDIRSVFIIATTFAVAGICAHNIGYEIGKWIGYLIG